MRLETESSLMVVPEASSERVRAGHVTAVLAAVLGALLAMPTAAAHAGGTDVYLGGVHVTQWHALLPLGLGIGTVLASAYLPRVLRPAYSKYALYGVFAGLAVAVLGAIGLVQLSPVEWYATDPVIPRAIHDPLMLVLGLVIAVASLLGGRYRWPTRPRYAGLGILLGAWVAYPGLMAGFGIDSLTHPLGYSIVLTLPLALGYILWRDARGLLAELWNDRLARRFGLAVGALGVIFFLFSTGMLTVIPDDGTGISLAERIVATLPVASPLVTWPAIEFWFPSLPLGGMFSVGMVLLLGVFGGLIGLNAALVAYQWQGREGAGRSGSGTTAGTVGVAAPQACCCCGPVLSQIAIVALGPSAAAPIYLLFADPSSTIGSLFLVASVAILTGTLVRAGRSGSRRTSRSVERTRSLDASGP
jgi:hypothetical protein